MLGTVEREPRHRTIDAGVVVVESVFAFPGIGRALIEAITENQPLKNETFAKLDRICPPHALLASNTSSCTITEMAAATKRPGQVLGLHFFNPVPLMKLVEVVQTILTDEKSVLAAYEWVQAVA